MSTVASGAAATGSASDVLAALQSRGFVQQCSNLEGLRQQLGEQKVTFYYGIDPTGDSLHAGHLVGLLAMAHLQAAGHRPILLIGGGTARVGDPTDKDKMRQLLPVERVAANAARITEQVGRFIDLDNTTIVNNADWLAPLHYLDFLREIGRHFSVNRMLGFEAYKRRLATGLSFLEFNYLLLQAYDFLILNQRHGCLLQIGGDDQWANILSGIDLVRRVEAVESYALTWPLVTMADGSKMGKTTAGAVFLDAERIAPYEFYQYWVNVPDADVGTLLPLLTMLPHEQIADLAKLRDRDAAKAKGVLAFELTQLVHGSAAAGSARDATRSLFSGEGADREALPSATLPRTDLEAGIPLAVLFARTPLCSSNSDARRLIQQGGAAINGAIRDRVDATVGVADIADGELLLRAGKKRYFRLVVEP
jgi:tyrosyl-tRNA synthetase